MAKYEVQKNSTGVLLWVFIRDASLTTVTGKTGLTAADFGSGAAPDASKYHYLREGDSALTEVALVDAATLGTWEAGGIKEIDAVNMRGMYELSAPDAMVVSGVNKVLLYMRDAASNDIDDTPMEVQIVDRVPVVIGPLVSTTQPGNRITSPILMEMWKSEAKDLAVTITEEGTGDPVDMSSKALRVVVQSEDDPPVLRFQLDQGSGEISVSGANNEVVTFTVSAAKAATASKNLRWVLSSTNEDDAVYAHGPFAIGERVTGS